jgi:hypothetical protein
MGKLAKIKTTENSASAMEFIDGVHEEHKRKDSLLLLKLMKKITKEEPKMWGTSIIGFGKLVYKSPTSGREVEWFKVGFAPRKANLTIYLMDLQIHQASLENLGKHKQGGGCLYINKLEDIDLNVLEAIIVAAAKRNSN